MIELVQWNSFSRSASGTPMRSAMASSGRLIAMSSTKLPDSFSAAARDDFAGSDRELLLERGDRPRCEQSGHELAQPGVLGRVMVDQQRLGQLELVGCGAVGQPHDHALAIGGPQVAVARDRLDVLVTADHPVAAVVEDRVGLLVPPHRRGLAQLGELSDGDALEQDIRVGEVIPWAGARALGTGSAVSERTCGLRHTLTIHCGVKCMAVSGADRTIEPCTPRRH